jgi:hypothetical protein
MTSRALHQHGTLISLLMSVCVCVSVCVNVNIMARAISGASPPLPSAERTTFPSLARFHAARMICTCHLAVAATPVGTK